MKPDELGTKPKRMMNERSENQHFSTHISAAQIHHNSAHHRKQPGGMQLRTPRSSLHLARARACHSDGRRLLHDPQRQTDLLQKTIAKK
jgi:hypothetical protein